jgi:ribosomal protein S18 acetylase RimI-like enzyme
MTFIQLQVPQNAKVGDSLTFTIGGEEIEFPLPEGSKPGDVLQIQVGGDDDDDDAAADREKESSEEDAKDEELDEINHSIISTTEISNLKGHISLRLASRLDVPSIQRCNLASLPENYSSDFCLKHIRRFPDLALVVEHVQPTASTDADIDTNIDLGIDPDSKNNEKNKNINGKSKKRSRCNNSVDAYNTAVEESQITGYVLGKIEEPDPKNTNNSTTTPQSCSSSSISMTDHDKLDNCNKSSSSSLQQQKRQQEILGHVTSLAILKQYRRNGLGALLMKQLHLHMKCRYSATGVGLIVRVSNVAAKRLYCKGMSYDIVKVMKGYYVDGEDAFFMKKHFLVDNVVNDAINGNKNSNCNDETVGTNINVNIDDKRLLGSRKEE